MNRWWSLLPPALVIAGGVCLYSSPWPGILRSMFHGAHVTVFPRFATVGLPLLTLLFWAAALVIAFRISGKLHDR